MSFLVLVTPCCQVLFGGKRAGQRLSPPAAPHFAVFKGWVPDSLHYRVPWRLGDNRVPLELIELGIETSRQKEQACFELAERFRASDDPAEAKRLGDKLWRMAFGE